MRHLDLGTPLSAADQQHIVGRQVYSCYVRYTDGREAWVNVEATGPMQARQKAGVGWNNVHGIDECVVEQEVEFVEA